ncbi:MAG: WbqC family protein [Bacteroidetes bacterium]|nr:WbqC family protein [Bacteroidota bacterium]
MNSVLLSTAYLPDLAYLSQVVRYDTVLIENCEHYMKQTHRNRCDILSSAGALRLSIPLVQKSDKEIISQKRISYAEKWQHQHWRTITTAYKNSPYFEFFEHEFKPFYETEYEFLLQYNSELLKTILNILRIKKEITLTTEFELIPSHTNDLRKTNFQNTEDDISKVSYYQVFADKIGFTPRLSCIDALFHIGLETKELLTK